ncbi:SDR family NAD(P)-dependent oxidoreductase [Pararhodobacter marinus]|uniref:Short-chain dehydrogenase n=2 Tax=Pararhodobacter marinus TaxID=2184063 RepID=A0A2U2CIJ3_9RHOB|nr:SDR family NAD(P)-dependent oxidoreductase [Pararhodobacter marinus]PWE31682.1 short-chain dehydrogenase [Pararhodobacter marinus]
MSTLAGQTWWLIGASEGLGHAVAKAMAQDGAELILSARSEDRLREVALETGGRPLTVDVSDPDSVAQAAEQAGEIDGLIYLAGAYWPLRAQEWDSGKIETMIDVNLTGAVRVLGHVLPAMIARDRGRIVLTGSLAGFRGLPGSLGYGQSKAGLMNLAQGLQADLQGTGVAVQLVNPGFIKTRLTDKNDFSMPFLMQPEEAAGHVVKAIRSGKPATSFPALFSWLFRAGRNLPTGMWNRIFARG